MNTRWFRVACWVLAAGLPGTGPLAVDRARADGYQLVLIPPLDPNYPTTYAYGINNQGVVVGSSAVRIDENDVPAHTFAYFHSTGALLDLGTLPDQEPGEQALGSCGYDINDSDMVVGWSQYSGTHFTNAHAYRVPAIAGAAMQSLGTLEGPWSGASGINNAGLIVGTSTASDGRIRAYRWTESQGMVELPGWSPNRTDASGINNLGAIVGARTVPINPNMGYFRAVLWPADGSEPVDLGTLGGQSSSARAINDAGVIVGDSQIAGNAYSHAFRKVGDGLLEDLGSLDPEGSSYAVAVNAAGQIVGWNSVRAPGGELHYVNHASLWQDGQWIDLHETFFPTWASSTARGINDAGWIVGYGVTGDYPGAPTRAWILIPEPATLALLLVGGLLAVKGSTRRQKGL